MLRSSLQANCTYLINALRSQNQVLYSYHKEEGKSSNPSIILKLATTWIESDKPTYSLHSPDAPFRQELESTFFQQ